MPKFIVKLCGKLTNHRFRKYRGCCDYSDIGQPVEYYYRCKICGYGFWNYNPPKKKEKRDK